MKRIRNANVAFRVIAILASEVCFQSANAEDWPMFGRDRSHNAVSLELVDAPTDWDVGKYDENRGQWVGSRNILWTARMGSQTFGDPVVADGQVWIGINNWLPPDFDGKKDASVLAGFATRNGKPLYRYLSLRLPQGQDYDYSGSAMACSPLIEGDRMWFVTNRCETVCLDLGPLKRGEANPREAWKIDMIQQFGVKPVGSRMTMCRFCSITSYKNLIYVITGNGFDASDLTIPAPHAASLICLNKETGELVWQDNSPGENIIDGQWSSPLVIETGDVAQVVTPQGDGWLRSFEALTGKLIWKFDINFKSSFWKDSGLSTRNNILATPVLYDGWVYVASGQYPEYGGNGPGRLVCIDPSRAGDISSELAVDAVGQPVPQSRRQAVDAAKGQRTVPNPNSGLVWDYTQSDLNGNGKIGYEETIHRTVANVAIKDNLLVAADMDGLMHCLDAKSGKVHWTRDTFASIYASPLIVGNKVYIANEDGKVLIYRLTAKPQEPLATIEMGGVSTYTSPIFANGVLYLATRSWLFAIAEPPK